MDTSLVPVESEAPAPYLAPGYYRCLSDDAEGRIPAGSLIYLLETSGGKAKFLFDGTNWNGDIEEFRANYRPEADGPAARAAEYQRTIEDIESLNRTITAESAEMTNFSPHIAAGQVAGIVSTEGNTFEDAKRHIALTKNSLAKRRLELDRLTDKLKSFAEEQQAIARAKAQELQEMVSRAEEAIWSINLYLGQGEEVFRLLTGKPADPALPVSIRQMVLFADEECAVAAEDGGLSVWNLTAFDEWLVSNPAHLEQVLPEQKGIVAIRPRREINQTGDVLYDEAQRTANAQTYLLIRNGENLYRLWTSFKVADHLVPLSNEFEEMFFEKRFDWETRTHIREPLLPGSIGYMRAEENANARHRHYYRLALVLQGLIDRTNIFHPLPGPVNVIDPWCEHVRIVTDFEHTLSDGRESYEEWFQRINSQIEPGIRVVGDWSALNYTEDGRTKRISPKTAECPIDSIQTIEGYKNGKPYFLFEYTRWDWEVSYERVKSERRASFLVYPNDRWILNFDVATVEEMEFFLRNRTDRHNYLRMFPLLKIAIRAKKEEAKSEEPFRLLLAGEMAKAHGISIPDAEEMLPELVWWWKYQNKTHRALLTEDAPALTAIVKEAGIRLRNREKRAELKARGVYDRMLEELRRKVAGLLLVAHKTDNEFVVLAAETNDTIFVRELIWKYSRGVLSLLEMRKWRTVDNRWRRWDCLYIDPRFEQWTFNVSRWNYLTRPEQDLLCKQALAKVQEKVRIMQKNWSEGEQEIEFLPLAVYALRSKVGIYYQSHKPQFHTHRPLSKGYLRNKLRYMEFSFYRDKDEDRTPKISHRWDDEDRELANDWDDWWGRKKKEPIYISEQYDENFQKIEQYRLAYQAWKDDTKPLEEVCSRAINAIHKLAEQQREQQHYQEFLAEYGDPELWEGHRKGIKELRQHVNLGTLRQALPLLVERGVSLAGRTVQDVWSEFLSLPDRPAKPDRYGYGDYERGTWYVPNEIMGLTFPEEQDAESS